MALFNSTSGGIPMPTDQQQPTPPDTENQSNVFQFVPTNLSRGVQTTIEGMFDGSALDASRARTNEALARAAQQYRGASGSQFAPMIGQGAAIRAQQGTERDIMQQVADTQLGFAEQEQAMKERATDLTMRLENLGNDMFNRKLAGVQILLQEGGADNTAEAAEVLGELFPGTTFDFSNSNLAQGMGLLSQMVSTGIGTEQAMAIAAQRGIGRTLGMSDEQMRGVYTTMMRQTNPMLATFDQIDQLVTSGEFDSTIGSAMKAEYMESLTGMEMELGADGKWKVIPNDGYTKVTSLSNVQPGDMIKFDTTLYTASGKAVPPGKYVVRSETFSSNNTNGWSGEVTTTTQVRVSIAGETATGEPLWMELSLSTDEAITEDHSSVGDWITPLGFLD